MPTFDDGGAAFPVMPPCASDGSQASGYPYPHDGATLRDYFIAHAPEHPQPWFDPVVPPCPKVPEANDIVDDGLRTDVRFALNADCDPKTPEGARWMAELVAAFEAVRHWKEEKKRQRWLQWPAAWADAQLEQRAKFYAARRAVLSGAQRA